MKYRAILSLVVLMILGASCQKNDTRIDPTYWPWIIGYSEADYPLNW